MNTYENGQAISAVIIFIGCWIYCTAIYGFLFGFGLGWIPSLIAAWIISWFWPVIVIGAVGMGIAVLLN